MIKDTADFYRCVLDDVVAKMKPEFVQEGVDESVLVELRALWEQKLIESGLLGNSDQEGPSHLREDTRTSIKQEDHSTGKRRVKSEPSGSGRAKARRTDNMSAHGSIPQGDAPADGEESDDADEDVAGDPEVHPEANAAAEEDVAIGDDKLEDVQVDDDDVDENSENFLIAQFEKVGRAKNRWKVIMKDGVFYLNGKDYIFKKLTGEFVF